MGEGISETIGSVITAEQAAEFQAAELQAVAPLPKFVSERRPLRVFIESPFLGGAPEMLRYLKLCMADSLMRGEAPYASHRLYPGILDDGIPDQRRKGLDAGAAWREAAELVVFYVDYGMSPGMLEGCRHAQELGHPMVERRLFPPRPGV